jgi:hypothetical protein
VAPSGHPARSLSLSRLLQLRPVTVALLCSGGVVGLLSADGFALHRVADQYRRWQGQASVQVINPSRASGFENDVSFRIDWCGRPRSSPPFVASLRVFQRGIEAAKTCPRALGPMLPSCDGN